MQRLSAAMLCLHSNSMQQVASVLQHSLHSWTASSSSALLGNLPCQPGAAAAAATARQLVAGLWSVHKPYSTGTTPPNAMDLIKELRKTSGAPIADVKACLAAANWDMAGAEEALRLKGLAAAVKKASRHASEGLVAVAQQGNLVSVVEINSETDFVGRSAEFQQLVTAAARAALRLAPDVTKAEGCVHPMDIKQLAAVQLESGPSIEEGCALLAGQVRENIALRRGYLVAAGDDGIVSSYVHMPVTAGAGRIAAVVALTAGGQLQQSLHTELQQLGGNLAMHSVGMNTQYISRQAISAEALQAVRNDLASATEAQMSGKPAAVMQKIVDGKLAKWCKDSCLLDQSYVLDDSITISQLLKQQAKQLSVPGGVLDVTGLLRVQVGEGMQREDGKVDFAAEVAAMAGGK